MLACCVTLASIPTMQPLRQRARPATGAFIRRELPQCAQRAKQVCTRLLVRRRVHHANQAFMLRPPAAPFAPNAGRAFSL